MNSRLLCAALASALLTQLAPGASARPVADERPTAATVSAAAYDVTDPVEAARVDRVDVSALTFADCGQTEDAIAKQGRFECGMINVPRDYDEPKGDVMNIKVARRLANNPGLKRGSVFINPGGPSGSAISMLNNVYRYVPTSILNEFDIVAVEPRGMGANAEQPKCFESSEQQAAAAGFMLTTYYPVGLVDSARYVDESRMFGRVCARPNHKIMRSMTTSEVIRDHEVVRRAVGDQHFNFFGFSYGTFVGQVYANMFPDRVGYIAIDGVVDGEHWTGLPGMEELLQDNRLRSGEGADRALRQLLKQCDEAGPAKCPAAPGATQKFLAIDATLRKGPIKMADPKDPALTIELQRPKFSSTIMNAMYSPTRVERVAKFIQDVHVAMTAPPRSRTS